MRYPHHITTPSPHVFQKLSSRTSDASAGLRSRPRASAEEAIRRSKTPSVCRELARTKATGREQYE